jgi:Rv0078B-related antitoxin
VPPPVPAEHRPRPRDRLEGKSIEIIDDRQAELLRTKTEAERFAMIDRFWRLARQMIRARITHEHPDWGEDKVQRELASRMSHGAV